MATFHRIATSHWESGGKRATVVEILDAKLWGLAITQELVHELALLLEQAEPKDVLLDLSRVEFISSAALNRLINFQKSVKQAHGCLKLCGLRPEIEEIFLATRFNQLFDIYPTPADALNTF